MARFLVHRAASLVPLLFVVSLLVFGMVQLMPGDPAEVAASPGSTAEDIQQIRERLGTDRPLVEQYTSWIGGVLRGDLGESLVNGADVRELLVDRFPVTMSLTLGAMLLAIVFGVSAGVVAATRPGAAADRLATVGSSLGLAVPNFWLALVLVFVFAVHLGWFPATGYTPFGEDPVEWARGLVLPAVALGLSASAAVARQTRSALVDVLQHDYVRAARAKGLSRTAVVGKHGLKNAAIPVVTVLGLQLTVLLGGSLVIEKVFALPGMGTLAISAVNTRDLPVIQGVVIFATAVVVITNLLVDLCYGWLNPKVRVS